MRWKQRNTRSGDGQAGAVLLGGDVGTDVVGTDGIEPGAPLGAGTRAAPAGVGALGGAESTGAETAPPSTPDPRITLIGKPGCHLCDDARVVVSRVAEDLAVGWRELDIDQDAALAEKYWEKVPVILVDGRPHDFWRVDERRLRAAVGG